MANEDSVDDGEYSSWRRFKSLWDSLDILVHFDGGIPWFDHFSWSSFEHADEDGSTDAKKKKHVHEIKAREKKGTSNTNQSWKWELFLAESRLILLSIAISALCAILSWIWYKQTNIVKKTARKHTNDDREDPEGGSKCNIFMYLPPLLLSSLFLSSLFCLLFAFAF